MGDSRWPVRNTSPWQPGREMNTSQTQPPTAEYLRDLVWTLTHKEIKTRYKNSCLGYAWSVLNPLSFAVVYFVAFGLVMKVDVPQYPLFLLAGLLPWQWVSHSMSAAPNIFLVNATLVKKVRFPWNALVISTVLNDGVHFLLSVPVIMLGLFYYGSAPSGVWLVGVPALAFAQFMLVYGAALAVASLNLFFRDLERLVTLLMTFLLFLTPITYSSAMIPESYRHLVYINPIAPLMIGWQQVFLGGELSWALLLGAYASAIAWCVFGVMVYSKLAPRFAEVI